MIEMRCLCVFTALLLTWASSLAKGGGLASLAAEASVPRLVVLCACRINSHRANLGAGMGRPIALKWSV